MTVFREISTMYASFFSLILFLILFESRYSRKKTLLLTLALMGPLMVLNFILLLVLGPEAMATWVLLTCSLPSLIFFWFLAKYRDGRFLFTFCFADTIMLEVIDITSILDFFLGNTYIFMIAARLLLCPIIAFVLWKWLRPSYLNLQNKVTKGWYTFAAIALIYYVMMSMFMSVPTIITQRLEQLPAFCLLLILLPFLYIHIFTTLNHQLKTYETKQRESVLSVQVTSLVSRMDEFSAANNKLKEERHNFRHKMRTIAALAANQEYSKLQAVAEEFAAFEPDNPPRTYSHHTLLDAVLSSYLQEANQKGIQVITKINFPEVLPVKEADLATVLANALENAIEACEKVEADKRHLEIRAIIYPCFMMLVRNSFDGIVAFDDEGLPVSARKGHGFGTRSIAAFCKQNHAFYEFGAEDQDFILRLVFDS